MTIQQKQQARKVLEALVHQTAIELGKYAIPEEKMQQVYDHVLNMFCKHKHLKPHRVARKTAEHFKLQAAA